MCAGAILVSVYLGGTSGLTVLPHVQVDVPEDDGLLPDDEEDIRSVGGRYFPGKRAVHHSLLDGYLRNVVKPIACSSYAGQCSRNASACSLIRKCHVCCCVRRLSISVLDCFEGIHGISMRALPCTQGRCDQHRRFAPPHTASQRQGLASPMRHSQHSALTPERSNGAGQKRKPVSVSPSPSFKRPRPEPHAVCERAKCFM
jgi:hypothetical protein